VVPHDLARIVGQYDGAIAYGDREFGRFVQGLRQRGLYDRATIVFLSDHGEEFLDHGGWVHGHTLFDELVRVPLVVKYPAGREAGRRVARQVQLLDVLPTILMSQGLSVPGGIAGRALEESFTATGPERPAVLETKYREHVAYGARTSETKYVRHLSPSSQEVSYDLRRDPRERRGRAAEASSRALALKLAVEASVSPSAFRHRVRVDGDVEYDLRLRTTGWIEVVGRVGLGSTDRAVVTGDGHVLVLRLRPEPGRPRHAEFLTRPHGVPVWIDGTRGGRRLRPAEVRVAAEGVRARALPFLLPEVEAFEGPFSRPRSAASGVSVWLVPARAGHVDGPLDRQARDQLKALGYLPRR
jgi:hypothetical protein